MEWWAVSRASPSACATHTDMGRTYGTDLPKQNAEVEIVFGLVKKC